MLGVRYDKLEQMSDVQLETILAEIMALLREEHYSEALRRLLDQTNFVNARMNAEFIREACYYYLGVMLLRIGRRVEFDELAPVFGPIRPDAGILEYGKHSEMVNSLLRCQRAAIINGMPSILIFSLMKSASAFLSNVLADMLGLALVRLDFDNGEIREGLLRHFALGGCVTHNHLRATPANLQILAKLWPHPIFVQIRDPRETIWSDYHHRNKLSHTMSAEETIKQDYHRHVDWIDGWLAARERLSNIVLIRYSEIKADAGGVVRQVLQTSGLDPNLYDAWKSGPGAGQSYNLRSADSAEWRREIDPALQDYMLRHTPRHVLTAFE